MAHIEKLRKGGAQVLDGRRFVNRHNNQTKVSWGGGRGVGDETRPRRNALGGLFLSFWAANRATKKAERGMRHQLQAAAISRNNTTTNRKQYQMGRGTRFGRGGTFGKDDYPLFGRRFKQRKMKWKNTSRGCKRPPNDEDNTQQSTKHTRSRRLRVRKECAT